MQNIFGGSLGSLGFSSAMMGGDLSSKSLFSVGFVTLDVNALMDLPLLLQGRW